MIYKVLLGFGVLLFNLPLARAAEAGSVSLQARGYTSSCAYYSQTSADFEVRYRDETLPWGTKVSVVFGFGGINQYERSRFDWMDRFEQPAEAMAPYTWSAVFSKVLHHRSSPQVLEGIQLVLKVSYPSGREDYVRGNGSLMGFYEANLPFVGQSPCLDSSEKKPVFIQLPMTSVSR